MFVVHILKLKKDEIKLYFFQIQFILNNLFNINTGRCISETKQCYT